MALVDTFNQIYSLPRSCNLFFIGEGLTPGHTVRFAQLSGGSDIPLGGPSDFVVAADGRVGGPMLAEVSATGYDVYIHDPPTNATATRVAGPLHITWTTPATCPVFGFQTLPVLTVERGDRVNVLHWTPATMTDPRGSWTWNVKRNGSNVAITLPQGTNSYIDAGLTNGTSYSYQVQALGGVGGTNYFSALSNVVSGVVPRLRREAWGEVLQ